MSSDDVRFGYDSVSKRLMSLEKLSPLRAFPKRNQQNKMCWRKLLPPMNGFFSSYTAQMLTLMFSPPSGWMDGLSPRRSSNLLCVCNKNKATQYAHTHIQLVKQVAHSSSCQCWIISAKLSECTHIYACVSTQAPINFLMEFAACLNI